MNNRLLPIAAILIAGASASLSAVAGPMGNEYTDMPQAQSSRSRADVVAETRAAQARGTLERTSYDELVWVVADRAAMHGQGNMASRDDVRNQTRAAMANGGLERSSYDEQVSVATQRQLR